MPAMINMEARKRSKVKKDGMKGRNEEGKSEKKETI